MKYLIVFSLLVSASLLADDFDADTTLVVIADKNLVNDDVNWVHTSETMLLTEETSLNLNIAELLEGVEGISLNGQGGLWQTFSIRGFSRWRINSFVDNIPIITDRRAGNSLSFISPYLIDSIQVSKGSGSILYGSGAIGGAVNLNTSRLDSGRFNVTTNTDTGKSEVFIGNNIEQMIIGLSLVNKQKGSTLSGDPLNDDYKQFSLVLKDQYKAGPLVFDWLLLPSYGKDIGKPNVQYPENKITEYPYEKHLLSKISVTNPSHWRAEIFSHIQRWQTRIEKPNKKINFVDYQSNDWGINSQYQWHLKDWVVRSGFESLSRTNVNIKERSSIYSLDSYQPFVKQLNLDARQDKYAFYIDSVRQSERFDFQLGGRYSYYAQQSTNQSLADNKFSYAALIRAKLSESFTINLNQTTGMRFPSLSERFFSGETGRGEVVGNPALLPENSVNREISLQRSEDYWEAKIILFHTEITDYIERISVAEEQLSFVNLASAKINGGEINLGYKHDHLSISLGYQWQKGMDQDDMPLADISPQRLDLNFGYTIDDWDLDFLFDKQFGRTKSASGERTLEPYVRADIKMTYYYNSQFSLSFGVNNLTNARYFPSADELVNEAPGRNFDIGLDWQF